MDIWQILILAVVQGVAEFLPISSSGHLVIVAALLGQGSADSLDVADVNIVLHLGTLVSILVFYVREVLRLLNKDRRVIPLIVIGTIPAVALGLLIKSKFEHLLVSPALAGLMLMATGMLLILTRRLPVGERRYDELRYWDAAKIGLAQSFALLPGISRSGTTIASGMACGLRREDAAAFSFLLAIPAIGGAAVLEIADVASGAQLSTSVTALVVGAIVSCIVGLLALKWLLHVLRQGRLEYFGYWCLVVGAAVLVWKWPL